MQDNQKSYADELIEDFEKHLGYLKKLDPTQITFRELEDVTNKYIMTPQTLILKIEKK